MKRIEGRLERALVNTAARVEQTRARYPEEQGYVERDGVRVFWERYGEGERTILLMPTWEIVHSRMWKGQIPYLARHFRVLTFDPRGNGRSDRPSTVEAYDQAEFAEDAVAVLDAAGVERVPWSSAGAPARADPGRRHPERVAGAGPSARRPARPAAAGPPRPSFDEVLDSDEGWARYNRHAWRQDWAGFAEFFFGRMFNEPHSTKQIEDCVGWALETDAATITLGEDAAFLTAEQTRAICARLGAPALVVQGDADEVTGPQCGVELARELDCPLVMLEGSGHGPLARDPVAVNLLLGEFAGVSGGGSGVGGRWVRGGSRRRRVLWVCSPIGLGHARRDLAIVDALRARCGGLEVEWLAQDPVTRVLAERGELVHPASGLLASESAHIAAESWGHELRCFEAIRRMDEILLANFMVFLEAAREGLYDLWVADEGWEVDYYLHENPELKSAAYVWLTDFVGWLPMADAGEREARLTADYNAEMIGQIARYPRVRDEAIFIGEPPDIIEGTFGPGLPSIRRWSEANYQFCGYVCGFDPQRLPDRQTLRRELGYAPEERVVIASVGGSGVGSALLRLVADACPKTAELVEGLRMILVAGPRIDPTTLPHHDQLEIRAYVPDLYRHLAACDLAIVQGGLATTMELATTNTPFLYAPLIGHFEQQHHVRHRLTRHNAGHPLDYTTTTPTQIAHQIATHINTPTNHHPTNPNAAHTAATLIAHHL